jgi:hypothetical protein
MPSLAHAYVKVRWANKQLKELESVCAKEGRTVVKRKRLYYQRVVDKLPKHSRSLFAIQPGATRMSPHSQILAGQIVNGLRSALDYLIGNLAELDSGPATRKTQFPAEFSAHRFLSCKPSFLKGLNPAHIAAIEKLQPYNGCNWTRPLIVLSNLDKHNALIPTTMDFVYSGMLEPVQGAQGNPIKYKVRMHIEPTVFIAGGQPIKLIEALYEIAKGVTKALESFKSEF